MFSDGDKCRTFVCSFVCATSFHNPSHPCPFCNYPSHVNPSLEYMLWEAAFATTVMPDLFDPIEIGDASIRERFVGGDLSWNNSIDELTKEAVNIFKGRRVACIISIGSGHPGHMSLSQGPTELFSRIALDCERVADEIERRFSCIPDVFWRLSVEQGLQHLAVDLSNLEAVVSRTHSYLHSARITHNIDNLLRDLVERPERLPIDRISGIAPLMPEVLCRKVCPPPSPYFTGRRDDIKRLDEYFTLGSGTRRIAVLYGLGGSGKSQSRMKFIELYQDRSVSISSLFTLENDLTLIALGICDEPTVSDGLHILGSTRGEWLLFMDNADDPSIDLRPYIMWQHGNILMTTRNHEMWIHALDCNIWVDKLEEDDAKELLLRGVDDSESSEAQRVALEIAQVLGCLALVVNHARAFLSQNIYTLYEYLHIYLQIAKHFLESKQSSPQMTTHIPSTPPGP
ncbi:hypothetical protein DL96DRAFT_273310 [Flagelloscypha sp. PMI_526]|nr:hypothetical protein DL96DRAFT_273310 [Flagelloscypha sp. PMI_526]